MLTFKEFFTNFKESTGHSDSQIGNLVGVDRTCFIKWRQGKSEPLPYNIEKIIEKLEENFPEQAEEFKIVCGKSLDHSGNDSRNILINASHLPKCLYPDITSATHWFPDEEEIKFIFATKYRQDEVVTLRDILGFNSVLAETQWLDIFHARMHEAKKLGYGITFFQENSVYFKKIPSNIEDIPEELRPQIIKNRIIELFAETGYKNFNFFSFMSFLEELVDSSITVHAIMPCFEAVSDKEKKKVLKKEGEDAVKSIISMESRWMLETTLAKRFGDNEAYMLPNFMYQIFEVEEVFDIKDWSVDYNLNPKNTIYSLLKAITGKEYRMEITNPDNELLKNTKEKIEEAGYKIKNVSPDFVEEDKVLKDQHTQILAKDVELPLKNSSNTLVVGNPASGKGCSYIKPNLLQFCSNYVVIDSDGQTAKEFSAPFKKMGYNVIILDAEKAMLYDPMYYIKTDYDIEFFTDTFMTLTNSPESNNSFWIESERNLLCACIGYIKEANDPEYPMTIESLRKIISSGDTIEEKIATLKEDSFATRKYNQYNSIADKSKNSAFIDISMRMNTLKSNIKHESDILSLLDNEKTVIFVKLPMFDNVNQTSVGIFINQAIRYLINSRESRASKNFRAIRFVFDEFANSGIILDPQMMAVMRKYGLYSDIIVQNIEQIKSLYGNEKTDWLISNCDTILCMGNSDRATIEWVPKRTKESIKPTDIMTLDSNKCIILHRGWKPVLADKYNLTEHSNYSLIANQ